MHYKKTQIIHSLIVDCHIDDLSRKVNLLKAISESELYVAISYKNPYTYQVHEYKKCRINDVKDNKIDCLVVDKTGVFTEKDIDIDYITFLEVVTEKNVNLSFSEEEYNKFDLLDLT